MDSIETQIAKLIYHQWMSNMKFTLDMEEHRYEHGRHDSRFKFFKKMLMANTYENMRELFEHFEKLGILNKTDYTEDVKDGYKDTKSGGAGYLNSEEFDVWLSKMSK